MDLAASILRTPEDRLINHTTRQCSWYQRTSRAPQRPLPPQPRPTPLTGANAVPVNAPPRPTDNGRGAENVNQVVNNTNNNNNTNNKNNAGPSRQNEYREHHQSYMVFVTEPTDKQSQHRRAMEVNTVMAAMPRYLNWSEQEVSWSRNDHPKVMPNPGGYALVVDPTFIGPAINTRFTRVLIDNGSAINIMYRDTMAPVA